MEDGVLTRIGKIDVKEKQMEDDIRVPKVRQKGEFEQDATIDEANLLREWVTLPGLYLKYAELAAEAVLKASVAKDQMKLGEASILQLVRSNPDDYGLDKVTESTVQAALDMDEEVLKVRRAYHDATYVADMYGAAKWAMDHKKEALKNITRMQTSAFAETTGDLVPNDPAVRQQLRKEAGDVVKNRGKK